MAKQLIDEAMGHGASKTRACEIVGVCIRTLQRWETKGFEDDRKTRTQTPRNKLNDQERQAVIDSCNQPENRSLSPTQIVPRLADQGEYIASESTFYRILRDNEQANHRGREIRKGDQYRPDEWTTAGPE